MYLYIYPGKVSHTYTRVGLNKNRHAPYRYYPAVFCKASCINIRNQVRYVIRCYLPVPGCTFCVYLAKHVSYNIHIKKRVYPGYTTYPTPCIHRRKIYNLHTYAFSRLYDLGYIRSKCNTYRKGVRI